MPAAASKRDYYEVLGVERSADPDALKRAFRKLAMQYHPDRNPGDRSAEDKFKEASEAYEVLSDSERRARYDRFGHAGVNGAGAPDFSSANINDIFGEIFGDIFGGGRDRRGRNRGSDLRKNLELSFLEAAFGTQVEVQLPRPKRCETCEGTGSRSKQLRTCPTCQGSGEIRFTQGFFAVARTCTQCGGAGQMVADPCRTCRGSGKLESVTEITVPIPAGVDTGTKVRVAGEGEPGTNGGPPGDLYVVVYVREHELFARQDNDVFVEVPVSFTQAALGADLEVPTLEGMAKVRVPEGTQTGHVTHLKGKGIPDVHNPRARGDFHVRWVVETPTRLSSRQKELLKQLAEAAEDDAHPRSRGFFKKVRELFK